MIINVEDIKQQWICMDKLQLNSANRWTQTLTLHGLIKLILRF